MSSSNLSSPPGADSPLGRHQLSALVLSVEEEKVLRHTLTGSNSSGEVYRNYFAASADHRNMPEIRRLLCVGFMCEGKQMPNSGFRYYHCTEAGARAIGLV